MLCGAPRTFRVLNPINATVGQRVQVAVPDGAVRRSAVYAYGLPLLALFAGAICGSLLAGETGAIFGAFAALLVTWFALWRSESTRPPDKRFQPTIRP
jgi:sigma-E factor negative regulatory protein RseC